MSLFKDWDDIEDDNLRLDAKDTYESLRGNCSCTGDLIELKQDIIESYLKQPSYNFD